MFTSRIMTGFKKTCRPAGRERKARNKKTDSVTEQVKQVLQASDQKLILMVRG